MAQLSDHDWSVLISLYSGIWFGERPECSSVSWCIRLKLWVWQTTAFSRISWGMTLILHKLRVIITVLWKFEADKAMCKWSLSLILKGAYWWAVGQQRETIPGIIWNPTQAIMDSGQGCELSHVSCRLSSRRSFLITNYYLFSMNQ